MGKRGENGKKVQTSGYKFRDAMYNMGTIVNNAVLYIQKLREQNLKVLIIRKKYRNCEVMDFTDLLW